MIIQPYQFQLVPSPRRFPDSDFGSVFSPCATINDYETKANKLTDVRQIHLKMTGVGRGAVELSL